MKRRHPTFERRLRFLLASAPSLSLAVGVFACASSEEASAPSENVFAPPTTLEAGEASDAMTAADVPSMTPRNGCSNDGFCYVSVPSDAPLVAVSASAADDAWMAPASGGVLLRWNGTSIERVYEYDGIAPASLTYATLWAEQHDNVWALARGSDGNVLVVRYASPPTGGAPAFRVLHTEVSSNSALTSWGTPDGDALWVATSDGVFRIREDGSGAVVDDVSPVPADDDPSGYFWEGIWGFAPDDVYVAGRGCTSRPCPLSVEEQHGALAHYDGTAWSLFPVAGARGVTSLRGTPPGIVHQLWYDFVEDVDAFTTIYHTELVPLGSDGAPGAVIHSISSKFLDVCNSSRGQATALSTGWFSNSLLTCRWSGTQVTPVATVVDGRQMIRSVNAIWANGTDDVWLVGEALTQQGFPSSPFAAHRTAATAAVARGEAP